MRNKKPWLTEFLDVLECPYCHSGEVTPTGAYVLNVRWCRCKSCDRDFRVSKKRWTTYERRADAAGASLARDIRERHGSDDTRQLDAVRKWGAWVCSCGLPSTVWERIHLAATEFLARTN